jgi:hypothetical protein
MTDFTEEELAWARKYAKLLGYKGGARKLLEMPWSKVSRMAEKKGMDWVIRGGLVKPDGSIFPDIVIGSAKRRK